MRFNEIFTPPTPSRVVEGLMTNTEWEKDKYANPFIDAVLDGDEPIISYDLEGEEKLGIVINNDDNKDMAMYLAQALENKDRKQITNVFFQIQVIDEDEQPIDDFDIIRPKDIFKDERITGGLRINLGNIAELVLGCAVTAKYEAQGNDIDEEALLSVATRLMQGGGTMTTESGKDGVSFAASVPRLDKKGFAAYVGVDPSGKDLQDYGVADDKIKEIGTHIKNAVIYVNTSPRVAAAIDKAKNDPGENEIEILSDGGNAEQQKVTKVDLKILINPGPDGKPQRLNLLSIKAADVKQFGQVSGHAFDTLNSFFEQSAGISLDPVISRKFVNADPEAKDKKKDVNRVRTERYGTGFKAAYDNAEKKLLALAKSDQLDLLERVYQGLLYHATRHEEGVEMVILSPNAKTAFKELTFGPELREALDDFQLVVSRGTSEKNHVIQVHGYPKTANVKKVVGTGKELLVQYRSYIQADAVRNVIEMGDLLKNLADWEKVEARKAEKQKQAQAVGDAKADAPELAANYAQQSAEPQAVTEPVDPQAGVPSGMTPAPEPVPDTGVMPDQEPQDDLNTIKRNAGIKV